MKKIKGFLSLILALILFVPSVQAVSVSDLANADESLKLEKNLFGTAFSVGNTVDISSKIDGISFVAGNTINDSSESDYLFEAGNFVNVKDIITKDAFIAGNQVVIDSNNIERDAYVVGSSVSISGNIGRNLYIGASTVTINGKIKGDLVIDAEDIKISDTTVIEGTLKYTRSARIDIENGADISKKEVTKEKEQKSNNIGDIAVDFFTSYGNILVLGLLLMLLMRKVFDKIDAEKLEASNVIKTMGIGFLTLIIIPLVSILAFVTGIGLATGFIMLILYGISIYASSIITSYYFGKKILNSKIDNDYTLFALSLLILKLVMLVPVIGGFISFLSLLFGLGMIIVLIKNSLDKKKKK